MIDDHLKRGLGACHRNHEGVGGLLQSNEIYRHCHRRLPVIIYLRYFLACIVLTLGLSCYEFS